MLGPFVAVLTIRLVLSILGGLFSYENITDIESGGSFDDGVGTINPLSITIIVDFSLQVLSCTYVSGKGSLLWLACHTC